MKKTLFITSALAVLAAAPAMAETLGTNEKPMNGVTYDGACVEDVLNSYTGPVNASPNYEIRKYSCSAGTYFVGGSSWTNANNANGDPETCSNGCPANNYCAGVTNHDYTTTDFGITECPANYASSDANSTAVTDCYRTCTASDVDEHAATFSGRFYANAQGTGDGQNSCVVDTCQDGWTKSGNSCVANTVTINWKTEGGQDFGTATTCTYDSTLAVPAAEPVKKGYTFTGWTFVEQQ